MRRILLKLTGEILVDEKKNLSKHRINSLVLQIKELQPIYQFGIVIGGGNFFRGNQHGKELGLQASPAHHVGMIATIMNGLILKDVFDQHHLNAEHFCALVCPEVASPLSQQAVDSALLQEKTVIFSGGTGNPYFSTDTNAILRSLQIKAHEVWKGTNVSGIYETDPRENKQAKFIKKLTFEEAIKQRIGVMDSTAYTLAAQYKQKVRIFNIFEDSALLKASQEPEWGSTLYY